MSRPRSFNLMLAAFALVIVLGVGGMVGLYSLATGHSAGSEAAVVRGIISAGLALAAVLLWVAAFFARRISRPLIRLTRAAQRLAAGDLAVRVNGGPVREIDDLAQAFNVMAATLAQADQQRRQLTADVAHELRTPLSIIRGRLEGLQDGVYAATPDQIAALL